eukprot:2291193-Rhodomonas_salina.1
MNKNKRRKATSKTGGKDFVKMVLEMEVSELEEEDDLLAAFWSEELHMDYAHSISLGYFKERYYLLLVVGKLNFMWATPTTARMEPEELLHNFLSVSNLKIGKIRTDNEFTASAKFTAFCKKLGM